MNEIKAALEALKRVEGMELDCALLCNMVGWRLQEAGYHVEVIEGVTDELDILHYWMEVNGEIVDPWAFYYDAPQAGYVKEDTYEVYRVISTAWLEKVWAMYEARAPEDIDWSAYPWYEPDEEDA